MNAINFGIIISLCLSACAFSADTPTEAFDAHYRWFVGRTIQDFRSTASPSKRKKILPNGNAEEGWGIGRTGCVVYYEFRLSDGVIVAWRVEGQRDKCVQSPYT